MYCRPSSFAIQSGGFANASLEVADGVLRTGFDLRPRRAGVHVVDVREVDQPQHAVGLNRIGIEHQRLERRALGVRPLVAPEMEGGDLRPNSSGTRVSGRRSIERCKRARVIPQALESLRRQELKVRLGHLRRGIGRDAQEERESGHTRPIRGAGEPGS